MSPAYFLLQDIFMLILPERLKEYSDKLSDCLEEGHFEEAKQLLPHISYMRVATALNEAPKIVVLPFLEFIDKAQAAHILSELPLEFAAYLLEEEVQGKNAAAWLALIPPRIAVDILAYVKEETRDTLIASLPKEIAENVLALSIYGEGMVGAEMSLDYLAIPAGKSVAEVLDAVRTIPSTLTHTGYLYVVDSKKRLQGVLSLRELLSADPQKKVEKVMNINVFAARVNDDPVDIAERIRSRHLKMIPVVTHSNVLVGVVTAETAMELLSYELAEDLAGIGGAGAIEESFFTPPRAAVGMRLPWMVFNVFLNLAAVSIIAGFEDTIAKAAILAAFLPMITDMGGNVGIQALSVSIRSMALGEARLGDYWRALRKEVVVGVMNGIALGYLFGVIAYFMEQNIILGIITGTALAVNVFVAGVLGGTLPFLIKRMGKDPAMITGPILTTITAITGVTIYFGLCTVFLFAIVK
jgi:magnesium transporter